MLHFFARPCGPDLTVTVEAKREIMERLLPEIFVDRYHVHGVTLRMGYNSDNRSKEYRPVETCTDTRYSGVVIRTIRHRGLKRLFEHDDPSKVRRDQVKRIVDVLAHLDMAAKPSDLDLPGYRLHPLKGDLKGFWSVTVSGNWRIVFRFEDGDAYDVDLVDYH